MPIERQRYSLLCGLNYSNKIGGRECLLKSEQKSRIFRYNLKRKNDSKEFQKVLIPTVTLIGIGT